MGPHAELLDTTLRDGSYAVGFQLTLEDACLVGAVLDDAGVPWIEAGHGWGIDVHGQLPFERLTADEALPPFDERAYFSRLRRVVRRARLGAPLFASSPGVNEASLAILTDAGCDFVRILIGADEIGDTKVRRLIEAASRGGLLVSVNLLKTYAYEAQLVENAAHVAGDLGAQWVYVVDSAGGMTPPEVGDLVARVARSTPARVGFHGHDNLGMAVANCLAAIDAGATLIDGSLQGLGRATGNPASERLAAWLQLGRGGAPDVDLKALAAIGRHRVRSMVEGGFDPSHVLSGFARFHSDWLPRLEQVAEQLGIAVDDALVALTAAPTADRTRFRDEAVRAACASAHAAPPRPPSTHRTAPSFVRSCADADDAWTLLRIAARRDRLRVAAVFSPSDRLPMPPPFVTRTEGWAIAWLDGARAGEDTVPPWVDRVCVADELGAGGGDVRARRFSWERAVAEALSASASGRTIEAAVDEGTIGLLDGVCAGGGAGSVLLVSGAAGVARIERALRERGPQRSVVVIGSALPFLRYVEELSRADITLQVLDPAAVIIAHTQSALREVRPLLDDRWRDPTAPAAWRVADAGVVVSTDVAAHVVGGHAPEHQHFETQLLSEALASLLGRRESKP